MYVVGFLCRNHQLWGKRQENNHGVLHRPKHNINTTIKRDIFRFYFAETGDITTSE